ncbi:MAG: hypothetical protein IJF84_08310 [Thermoguttaceae bacterium]|nr:hypothetical protein [Thermoguttaceae bacterium]
MRFNKDSLKNFIVDHTEKVIFGFFVLGFLFMIWGGFSLKPLSITTSQFEDSIKRGRQKLDASMPDVAHYTSIDYEKEADLSAKPISPKALSLLELNTDFRHPIAQPQVKRTQPPVLTVTELQVSSGVGFSPDIRNDVGSPSRTGQNSGKTQQLKLNPGVRWVVVTALIPNLEQEKKFYETFKNSDVKYPESDRPSYYSYYIEREEITSAGSQGWKPLDVKESVIINRRYSNGGGAEVVEQEFLTAQPTPVASSAKDPAQPDANARPVPVPVPMAMHLMNLSKHQWGADCAHLPEIPLIAIASRNDEMTMDDELGTQVMPAEDAGHEKVQQIPTYKLFRFFDTRVEGGKKYRYRVKLVLRNPNYNVKSEYVENESMTVNPFIEGDWSQASPIAEVPHDTRLYCIGFRGERSPQGGAPKLDDYAGPSGQLLILKFDEIKGLEISKRLNKDNTLPGMVLNFYNTDFDNLSDDFRDQSSVANFITNDVILDFSSKTKQSGTLFRGLPTPPVRTLLMSKDGSIFVQAEDKDKPEVYLKSNKPVIESTPSNYGRGGQMDDDRSGGRQTPKRNTKPTSGDHGIFE